MLNGAKSIQGTADRIMAEAQSTPEVVVRRSRMDRFIDGIELVAAFFVGIVAADIFTSVLLRYLFSVQIPDSYDFGRLLLGILDRKSTRLNSSHLVISYA